MIENTISIVTLDWNREPERLDGLLQTLEQQTVSPLEVVVVSASPGEPQRKRIWGIVEKYPLARVVEAPRGNFSMSWGFNVGIKRTNPNAQYVLTTGVDMLFGPNVIETVLSKICDRCFCVSHCGFLKEGVKVEGDPHASWGALCGQIDPFPITKVSTGAMMAAPREWWFKVRGYDEVNHAFAFADSDVSMRMKMDGLSPGAIFWEEMKLLHVWHRLSPLVAKVGGARPNDKWGIIRNPNGWGEI